MRFRLIDRETQEVINEEVTFEHEDEQIEMEEIAEHLGFYLEEIEEDD